VQLLVGLERLEVDGRSRRVLARMTRSSAANEAPCRSIVTLVGYVGWAALRDGALPEFSKAQVIGQAPPAAARSIGRADGLDRGE